VGDVVDPNLRIDRYCIASGEPPIAQHAVGTGFGRVSGLCASGRPFAVSATIEIDHEPVSLRTIAVYGIASYRAKRQRNPIYDPRDQRALLDLGTSGVKLSGSSRRICR
jgi:hypothetical protein